MKTIIFYAVMFCSICGDASAAAAESGGNKPRIEKFSDLDGGRIGVLTGTLFEYLVNDTLERTQLFYYDKLDEMLRALREDRLDCIVDDETALRYVASRDARYRVVEDRLAEYDYAFLFSLDRADLREKFDAELSDMLASGEVAELSAKWMRGEGAPTADYERYSGTALVRLTVFTEAPPMVFRDMQNNIVGIEVEIVERICRRLGYRLEVSHSGFDAMFDVLADGRADLIASSLAITEERKQAGIFGIPHSRGGACSLVLADN